METQEINEIKNNLMLQCWNCKFLNVKKRDITTKQWSIQCCAEKDFHEIYDLASTPISCPFYAERFILMISTNTEPHLVPTMLKKDSIPNMNK
jgi:hypothetical protein